MVFCWGWYSSTKFLVINFGFKCLKFGTKMVSILLFTCNRLILFVSLQGWLYRLDQDGSSQAKLLLHRFVARAAELKIPVCRSSI